MPLPVELENVVFRSKASLMWSMPFLSPALGMPWVTPSPLGEVLFNDKLILLRSQGGDKFVFGIEEVEILKVFNFPCGYGFRLFHKKENYPHMIIFGFVFNEEKKNECGRKLWDIGFQLMRDNPIT